MNELMAAWRQKILQYGGLLILTFEQQNPKLLDTMFKNGMEAMTEIMVMQYLLQGLAAQMDKKCVGVVLSLRDPIMAHVSKTLHLCRSKKLAKVGWVCGNAWFVSIPYVVELKNKLGVFSIFIIKQNVMYGLTGI